MHPTNRKDNPDREGYGLTVDVYRSADGLDCTLGGITSQHRELTLVGIVDYTRPLVGGNAVRMLPKDCRVFEPIPEKPPVWLVVGKHRRNDRHLIPGDPETGFTLVDDGRQLRRDQ